MAFLGAGWTSKKNNVECSREREDSTNVTSWRGEEKHRIKMTLGEPHLLDGSDTGWMAVAADKTSWKDDLGNFVADSVLASHWCITTRFCRVTCVHVFVSCCCSFWNMSRLTDRALILRWTSALEDTSIYGKRLLSGLPGMSSPLWCLFELKDSGSFISLQDGVLTVLHEASVYKGFVGGFFGNFTDGDKSSSARLLSLTMLT